jgi:DNA-binding response OmpR family regulator
MAKILLIEDDVDIADNTILFLEHKKHQVTHVASGMDGLEQMRFGKFDLVILDGHLPDLDGLEVCINYREEGGTMPILMASGRSNSMDQKRGKDAGVNAYVIKPYSLIELETQIDSLLSSVHS